MKQIIISVMLLFALGLYAQDVVVTKPKKEQTTTVSNDKKKADEAVARKRAAAKRKAAEKAEREAQARAEQLRKEQAERERKELEKRNALRWDETQKALCFNGMTYKMVFVSGGTFTMGATSEMKDPYNDEKPTHQVTLSSFYIGQTEVTQALWKAVMGSNPSYFKGDNLPVEQVSWNDCQTFISKLNSLTGKRFRLPTEAEWEFAARGGGNNSKHTQYSGSNNLDAVAWYDSNSGNKTHPVATKQHNELGIYDMTGNVWEWCSDWYGSYSSSSQTNPKGPNSGTDRVCRGGSWYNGARICRSSIRCNGDPGRRNSGLGFRLCLSE